MQLNVNGAQTIEVSERTSDSESDETPVHQTVVVYMADGRQGNKAQKTRSEVSDDDKKSWYQKGIGRVRADTIRSPIRRGGGTTLAVKSRSREQKLNKKMHHAALCSIPAELVRLGRLIVVADFIVDAPKTKGPVAKLDTLGLKDVLVVTGGVDENLYLAARNLAHVDVRGIQGSDPVSLIAYNEVLVTVSAVKKFEELLG